MGILNTRSYIPISAGSAARNPFGAEGIGMSESKNYEAIGRYVDAKDQLGGLDSKRHNLAGEISRLLKDAIVSNTDIIHRFDDALFISKANELAEVNQQLEKAISEVDLYADQAKKPGIRR
jgi:hypothetical protein